MFLAAELLYIDQRAILGHCKLRRQASARITFWDGSQSQAEPGLLPSPPGRCRGHVSQSHSLRSARPVRHTRLTSPSLGLALVRTVPISRTRRHSLLTHVELLVDRQNGRHSLSTEPSLATPVTAVSGTCRSIRIAGTATHKTIQPDRRPEWRRKQWKPGIGTRTVPDCPLTQRVRLDDDRLYILVILTVERVQPFQRQSADKL
jgi:hypothetical protein